MKTGLIVYNLTQYSDKYMQQINAYMNAFDKIRINLLKASNSEVIENFDKYCKVKFVIFYDKDIALAREFELHGIRVFNRSSTISLCDDKALTYQELKKNKVPMPKTVVLPYAMGQNLYDYLEQIKPIVAQFTYPFIIKERVGSFGDQVYLVNDENELASILRLHGDKPLLIQEYIEASKGRDVRAFVIGNKVVIAVNRINENDFRSNVNQGGVMSIYKKKGNIKKIAIKASLAVNADFSGVDIVFNSKNKPLVLEVNSNPRTESIKEATKVDVTTQVARYVKRNYRS